MERRLSSGVEISGFWALMQKRLSGTSQPQGRTPLGVVWNELSAIFFAKGDVARLFMSMTDKINQVRGRHIDNTEWPGHH